MGISKGMSMSMSVGMALQMGPKRLSWEALEGPKWLSWEVKWLSWEVLGGAWTRSCEGPAEGGEFFQKSRFRLDETMNSRT